MENKSRYKTIDHIIGVEENKEIHVWETLPKENSPKRKNTLIIASGFARRMDHFAGLAEYLSQNGFHVIRYDSLHHVGLSSGTIDEFTMSIGKQSLLAVVDWLNTRNINNLGMLASSLSARIAYASLSEIHVSFLITAVGVVNLRYTLERALGFDYLSLPIDELPDNLDFEGHKLGAEVFARDCFDSGWEDLTSTINSMMHLDVPFIAFTANNDDWVKQDEVITLLSSMGSQQCKIYSLLGSSHDLGENLVVLRNFYQSVTKAAIAMDNGRLDIDVDIIEPSFEHLTIAAVNERRMKIEIENQAIALS
ncbi:acyl transferase [Photorhabdus heterorhabditis]|uniref:Acyl transferase n=1 Tax=Photorhabdus heterorhabditis TaxID=880156 RepID=A0ABR5K862_9GAMM|nr:acyl transferase [Photorhabdus heterorhabditis]KOY60782.1 acyl transferase [Photorhabdus heterorhabditis]MBS9443394.1 acyl transferase [Photorhabdus heterorhabditis]